MGTRGITWVIQGGERKVGQYGQWDHYPEGQGLDILRFISVPENLAALREKIEGVTPYAEAEVDAAIAAVGSENGWMTMEQSDKFGKLYPSLTRDTGGKILGLIADGTVTQVQIHNYPLTDEDRIWIEGQYTVDFDGGVFIAEWGEMKSWPLDNLPTEDEFLAAFARDEED